jgi:hypothetical protein
MTTSKKNPHYAATEKLFIVEAELKLSIAKLGDTIAKNEGYKDLIGLDAVYRFLIDKYHWLPEQVRSLSVEDLNMLLSDYPRKKKA